MIQKSSARFSTKFMHFQIEHCLSLVLGHRTEAPEDTRKLFCRSAAVPGRPRPREPFTCSVTMSGFCSTGATGDGRAPTEELSCIRSGAVVRWPVVVTSSDTETSHLSLHPGQAGERTGRICQPSARQFALVRPPRLSFAD